MFFFVFVFRGYRERELRYLIIFQLSIIFYFVNHFAIVISNFAYINFKTSFKFLFIMVETIINIGKREFLC